MSEVSTVVVFLVVPMLLLVLLIRTILPQERPECRNNQHGSLKKPIFGILATLLPFVAMLVAVVFYQCVDTEGFRSFGACIISLMIVGIGIAIASLCSIVSLFRCERWCVLMVIEFIVYAILSSLMFSILFAN
jgi:hypothetical protein